MTAALKPRYFSLFGAFLGMITGAIAVCGNQISHWTNFEPGHTAFVDEESSADCTDRIRSFDDHPKMEDRLSARLDGQAGERVRVSPTSKLD